MVAKNSEINLNGRKGNGEVLIRIHFEKALLGNVPGKRSLEL